MSRILQSGQDNKSERDSKVEETTMPRRQQCHEDSNAMKTAIWGGQPCGGDNKEKGDSKAQETARRRRQQGKGETASK